MILQLSSRELAWLSEIWHLKCGKRRLGPYSYPELIKMIKEKGLTKDHELRNQNLASWTKIKDLDCLKKNVMDQFLKNYSPREGVKLIRSHVRLEIHSPVRLITKNGIVESTIEQLSAGGCRVQLPANYVEVGDEIKLHVPYVKSLKLKPLTTTAKALRIDRIHIEKGVESQQTMSFFFKGLKAKYKKNILKVVQRHVKRIKNNVKDLEILEDKMDFVKLGMKRKDHLRLETIAPLVLDGVY